MSHVPMPQTTQEWAICVILRPHRLSLIDALICTRRKFGVHTLKCTSTRATACVSSGYSVNAKGKCGASRGRTQGCMQHLNPIR